jgi:hypothetical protein
MKYIVEIKRDTQYLVEGVPGNFTVYPDNSVGPNNQYLDEMYEEPPFHSTAATPIEAVVESGMPRQNIVGVTEYGEDESFEDETASIT